MIPGCPRLLACIRPIKTTPTPNSLEHKIHQNREGEGKCMEKKTSSKPKPAHRPQILEKCCFNSTFTEVRYFTRVNIGENTRKRKKN
jgi:hypothetical protein